MLAGNLEYVSGENNASSLLNCKLALEIFFSSNFIKNTTDFSLSENDILKILSHNFLL